MMECVHFISKLDNTKLYITPHTINLVCNVAVDNDFLEIMNTKYSIGKRHLRLI